MAKAKLKDLVGNVYNNWTVLRLDRWQAGKGFYWFCRCACGVERDVREIHLLSEHCKSCGCLRKETRRKEPEPCAKCGVLVDRRTAKGG